MKVTEYYFQGNDVYPPFVIVDTPGFADTNGLIKDKEHFTSIKNHLNRSIGDFINAVIFIAKDVDQRKTQALMYSC